MIFDGIDDVIAIDDNVDLGGMSQISIDLWVNPANMPASGSSYMFISKNDVSWFPLSEKLALQTNATINFISSWNPNISSLRYL